MLTRDGERVLEVLLVAAGLALVTVFHDDLPGRSPTGNPGAGDPRAAYTGQMHNVGGHRTARARAATGEPVSAGPIGQALAELERLTSRC